MFLDGHGDKNGVKDTGCPATTAKDDDCSATGTKESGCSETAAKDNDCLATGAKNSGCPATAPKDGDSNDGGCLATTADCPARATTDTQNCNQLVMAR